MNHRKLVLATLDEIATINFLQMRGILLRTWTCDKACGDYARLVHNDGSYCYRCSKCGQRRSLKSGSWLEKSKLGFVQIIDVLYFWAGDSRHDEIRKEAELGSSATSTDWARYCREVCISSLCNNRDSVIGGDGAIVKIDESLITKRKFNVGRQVIPGWVFGGLERGSRRCFFEFVPDRTEQTLVEVIKRRVAHGTTIYSDEWRSYRNLSAYGYTHLTVNHSRNFVNPVNGTHTQNIESEWSQLKRFLRSCGRNIAPHIDEYIAEFIYRRAHADCVFEQLLTDISHQFGPK
jgi:transposase-like protein